MEEKKNKCPLCNKRLVMKDGVPTCPDCGYRDPYRSSGTQTQGGYSQSNSSYGQPGSNYQQSNNNYNQPNNSYSQPNNSYQQSNSSYSQPNRNYQQPNSSYRQSNDSQSVPPNGSYRPPNYGQPRQNLNQPTKKNNSAAVVIVAVITVSAVMTIVSVLVGLIYSAIATGEQDGREWGGHVEINVGDSSVAVEYQESSSASSTQSSVSSVSHLTFNQPESELLKEFVDQLFGKSASSVTRDELNSVIRLELRDMYNYNGTEISYELSDGTTGTCYLSSTRVDSEDFKCFPNIQTLDLGRNSLDWQTDWHGLTALTSLTCKASLGDLAEYMDVSQLTVLSLSCDFMMNDCSDLGAYSNLEYLKLDCDSYGMELTGISQAASLKTLIIEDGDYITDFGELYDMTQLRELSIESDGLRDIGFIRDMSGLESLELISTELLRIDAVADRADTLKCLRLHQNYSVEDYSTVFECTGLEELELYVKYDFNQKLAMPDLSMMPGLKVLTLGNYELFPGLEDLTALESLTLMGAGSFGGDGELRGLERLTSLKKLALIDMSMEPELLESFAGVASLETLDLTDSFIWGDINTAFEMPNLKELIMEDVSFGLWLDEMPVSESLQVLDLTNVTVYQLREDGNWNYTASDTQITLGGYTEFFGHMPNLTFLKVPKQELQDVKFAENLSQLAYLDITNNYVSDLSPLAGLGQLKVLVCENNPVHDVTGLKNVIIIK